MKPQTFRPCPSLNLFFFVCLSGIAALFWPPMEEGEISYWFGWFGTFFFGFLAIVFPVLAILGKPSLKLYDEGFSLRLLFGQHRYEWENVHSIRLDEVRIDRSIHKFVAVEIDKEFSHPKSPDQTFTLQISTALFLTRPGDLANMMNAWRDAALLQNDLQTRLIRTVDN